VPANIHRIGVTLGRTNKLKFLTFWDALLQATFFTVCFINDVLGHNKDDNLTKTPRLRKLQDMIMSCLAFPISMFVGLTFWGLYFVDRELVLPKAIDPYFPWWLNHCMHTNIMVFVLIEMVMVRREYPSRRVGLSVLISFMLLYLVWVHVIFSMTGVWVYPVLDVLNLPMRLVFFGGLLSLAVVLYCVGEKLNTRLWGKAVARKDNSIGLGKLK